jgi:hypothetical protein
MNKLQLRLEDYWRTAVLNAALLPAIAIYAMAVTGQAIGPLCVSCLVPTSVLLMAVAISEGRQGHSGESDPISIRRFIGSIGSNTRC